MLLDYDQILIVRLPVAWVGTTGNIVAKTLDAQRRNHAVKRE